METARISAYIEISDTNTEMEKNHFSYQNLMKFSQLKL